MKQFYVIFLLLGLNFGLLGQSTEVGSTTGELSVSLAGAANYTIPIAVPPGINGVAPKISLVYNSQSGIGNIGCYGWNIGGMSTIERIPSTKYHDGVIDPVDFDNLDRFALDGQRLIVKNGVYGADKTVYETEIFSNLKITSYGVHPNGANYGPANFLVEYPDGSKAYYGNSSDSKSITTWAITYWENPQGVRISYNYSLTNNVLDIVSVKYGTLTTATPINEIIFNYGGRIRPEQGYVGGQSFSRTKKLTSVTVNGNGVGFRNYVLEYNAPSLDYETLNSITEKNGNSTKSYNPISFSYGISSEVILPKPGTSSIGLGSVNSKNSATVSGDFNGDGKMGFALFGIVPGNNYQKDFWLFEDVGANTTSIPTKATTGYFHTIFPSKGLTADGKMYPYQGLTLAKMDADPHTVNFETWYLGSYGVGLDTSKKVVFPERYISNCNSSSDMGQDKIFFSGDFNGDGLTDVMAMDNAIQELVCEPDPYGGPDLFIYSTNTTGQFFFVDLDRRKTTNFVNYAGLLQDYYLSTDSKIETFDANGDGKTDILHFKNGKVYVYTLNNSNQLELLWQTLDSDIKINQRILSGDYNGDGKMDFLIAKGTGTGAFDYFKFLSKGNGFVKSSETYSVANMGYSEDSGAVNTCDLIPIDINADGKTDIVQFRSQFIKSSGTGSAIITVYKNLGSSFLAAINPTYQTTPSTSFKSYPIPVFLSPKINNQYFSVATISDSQLYAFDSQNVGVENLLQWIKDSNGVRKMITYSPLQQDRYEPFYTPTVFTETFPYVDIAAAPNFRMVTKLEEQSTGAYKKQLFNYSGAVSNADGLGFMGFRSTMRTNWHNDTTQVIGTISKNSIALRGANIENFSVLDYQLPTAATPSSFISRSVLIYNTDALQSNKIFKLKNLSVDEFNGLDGTGKTTTTSYDQYNNPLTITSYLKEGGSTVHTTTTTIVYKTPNVSPYYVGVPLSKTQNVSVSGSTMTSEEVYEHNNLTYGLLSKVRRKGDNTTNYVDEKNDYDNFGNIIKKTITATGLTPRSTSYIYDASGRFVIRSTDDIEGVFKTFDYNLSSGVLNSETNENNLTTSYVYDSWFKKNKITDYLGKSITYTYSRSADKTIIIKTGDDNSIAEDTYDDLGRKIKLRVKDVAGNFSSIDYLYDIYDRNYKISEPYFGTSGTLFNETTYDVYGRLKKSISSTGKVVSMSYYPLTTKITITENLKSKDIMKNAMGKIVSITDTPGGKVNYTYFANGNLRKTDFSGAISEIFQDGWGRKIELRDSSLGTYKYEYNDLGEITKETTPNGITNYVLDPAGKIKEKTISGGNHTNSKTTYSYVSGLKLLLSSKFDDFINNSTITNAYTYDDSKRLIKSVETTPYAVFIKDFTYDTFARIATETSTAKSGVSSIKKIEYKYSNGTRWRILDGDTGVILWETSTLNAKGQLLTALNGPVAVTNTYDTKGYMSAIKYDKASIPTNNILTLNTVFDPQRGNLTSRTNSLFNKSETFKYDSLDRLIEYTNGAGNQEAQVYDDRGRITQNNVGTYNYNLSDKPYCNTSIDPTPQTLSYYTARPSLIINYNTFKAPLQIEENGIDKISFTYNDKNKRSTMFYGGLQNDKLLRQFQKYYSTDGTMEIKKNISTGALEFITYIGGDGYNASVVLKSDGSTQKYLYLMRDYQSSIVAIADQSGSIVEKRLFDAWGNIVSVQNGAGTSLAVLTILDRGYTGHEHLQSVGIINMNGRLYDPKLHRFLQPDNFVQDSFNTQNFNRYSYVLNNPLMYTDFTGEKFKLSFNDILAAVEIVGGAVLTVVTSGAGAYVGGVLIASGVTHFAAAYSEYKQTGDWGAASKNAGVFFNVSFNTDWGYGDSKESQNGVSQNVPVIKPKILESNTGNSNTEATVYNYSGMLNAGMGIVGGVIEVVGGVSGEIFTAGFSTVLIVDGVYRIGSNSARLGMYLYGENKIGDALPSNGGALAGMIIDGMNGGKFGEVGPMQNGLGFANDMLSFLATGGNGQAYRVFLEEPGLVAGGAIFVNWYTVGTWTQLKL